MSKKITKNQLDPAFVADLVLESEKGMPNGVPSLGADGKVPATQLSVTQPSDATTSVKGIVMLDDTTTSSSTTKAATANSVKSISDRVTVNTDQINLLSDEMKILYWMGAV